MLSLLIIFLKIITSFIFMALATSTPRKLNLLIRHENQTKPPMTELKLETEALCPLGRVVHLHPHTALPLRSS